MAELKKRRITIEFDCEHLETSIILGDISDDFLKDSIEEFFNLYLTDVSIYPEEGDFYKLTNPRVIFQENK